MPNNNNGYNKKLKSLAQGMRNESTRAEVRLWCELLRNKKMMGFTFLRQRPVSDYIADFLCKDLKLVIELDGRSHDSERAALRDDAKDRELTKLGFTILRIKNTEVRDNIDGVFNYLVNWIKENHADKLPEKPL